MWRCPATRHPIGSDPELVGQVLAGRYHLVRLLGGGGMASVYKAADQVLRRFVAIKLLHPAVAESPAVIERFEREARAAAAIGHPNIIDILDFGHEAERPYMVMEYLRGQPLSHVIAMDGPLAIKRAATIAIHTLAGLAAAHDRGILHRDLKPANLMLVVRFGDRNFTKVCDFGFAALLGRERRVGAKALTPERTLVGTPAYAAPERLAGDPRRDPRLDVYSVGVVLYEMLAGRRPFEAPSFHELARKVRSEDPPSLRVLRPDVPEELEWVVMRALAKDRDARWPSAEAFAEALFPFGGMRVPLEEDPPSDSFTVEMMRIKAREARFRDPMDPEPKVAVAPESPHGWAPYDGDVTQRLYRREVLARVRALDRAGKTGGAVDVIDPAPNSLEIPIDVEAAGDDGTTATDGGSCSGRIVLPILRFIARRFGERALKNVLDSLPPHARRPFTDGIDRESEVDLEAVRTLLEHIDARLGQERLHLVFEAGRAAAEGVFDLVQRLAPPKPPPELLVAEMPDVLGRVLHGIGCEVRRIGRGYGRVELVEAGPPSLTITVAMLGFLARTLEHFGASDVEVNLLGARAFGDPETSIDLSWLA
jgi:tRNA A-37 threonylcarbamoyl transferase component Bud32